jgi:hypothetical protein
VDGGVLADRFLERESFGFFRERNGHGRDFGGRRFRYIAPVEKSVGVVDLVKTCDLPESISSNLRV